MGRHNRIPFANFCCGDAIGLNYVSSSSGNFLDLNGLVESVGSQGESVTIRHLQANGNLASTTVTSSEVRTVAKLRVCCNRGNYAPVTGKGGPFCGLCCGKAVGVNYLNSQGNTIATNGLVQQVDCSKILVKHVNPEGVISLSCIPANYVKRLEVLRVNCCGRCC